MRVLTACALIATLAACAHPVPSEPAPAAAAARASAALAPGERRIKASDGAELYLKVAGRGPVCMLVHGGPGQGSLSTEKMGADKLEDFLTMVWFDQRGSGKSPDAQDYRLERVVQDFEDARQALGVDKMCLIAHSFGGILAVEYAKRYPQHVSKLVMANTTLHFLGPENARMQIDFVNRVLGKQVVKVADDADENKLAKARDEARAALMKSGNGYRFLSETTDSIKVMGEIDGGYARSRGFGNAIFDETAKYPEYMRDYTADSAAVAQPVLVIAGSKDFAVGPDEHKRFRFPNQKVVVLNGGHISYYENNAEFVGAIRGFMADRQ